MTVVVVAARIALAALFAVASIAKLRGMNEWRTTLLLIGVPQRRIAPVAWAIPVAELMIAGALTLNATSRLGALAAVAMLCAFSVGVSVAVLRRTTPDCNCFGSLSSQPLGWRTVGRNLLFAALAGLVAWDPDFGLSATEIVGVVAALAIGAQAWFGFALLQQNGRLLARVDALESGASRAPGLTPGMPAPAFVAQDLAGGVIRSEDIWLGASTTLLAFVAADCPACDEVLPDLSRWQRERLNFNVAVVTSGDLDQNRRKLVDVELWAVAMQRSTEVTESYRVPGTPAAMLVGADGIVMSELALGVEAVRTLANGGPLPASELNPSAVEPREPIVSLPVAAAGATAALLAGASGASARADDPGIAAIQATLDASKPTILADFEGLKKGVVKSIGSKKKQGTSAAHAAISKQRGDLLELRSALVGLTVESAEAQATRDSGVASFDLQVQALDEFDHLLGLRSKKARKRSEKKAYGLLQLARQSGSYLNIGLGCTGDDC